LAASNREITVLKPELKSDLVYPNPFNNAFQISINQKIDGPVNIELFDLQGKSISTIYRNSFLRAGQKMIKWNASDISSGAYFIRVEKTDSIEMLTVIKSE